MENKEKNPLEGSKKETSFEELTAEKKSSDVMYLDELTEKALEKGIELNLPVLLIGETGTGKTGAIKNVAQKKGVDLIRLNLTGQTGVDEILGKFLVNSRGMYWVDGLLIKAMKEGHWIVFDEINMALPEILSALHSLLDDDRKIVLKERNGELIRPHANFRFFATMNPSDEYTGTKELNKAFLSRFPIIQSVEYSNKEVDIISDRTGLKKQDAEKVAMIAKEIRDLKNKEKISYTCSTRDILAFSKLLVNGFKIQDAFMLSIANKVATKEEKVGVMKVAEFVTGEKMDIGISIDGKIHNFSSFEEVSEKIKESKKRVEDIESINKNLITEMEELKKNGVNEINEIKKELEKIKSETNDDSKEIEKIENKLLIENGKRKIAEKMINKIAKDFDIDKDKIKEIKKSINL